MDGVVDFGDDQPFAIGAEVAAFGFRFVVDGIALRKLGEVAPPVDLRFEIFRGRKIGQQHLGHPHFERRQEFVGMLLVIAVQFLFREFDLGFDPIFEELIDKQLFPVALRSIADGVVLVESLLARFLHEQFVVMSSFKKTCLPPSFSYRALVASGSSPQRVESVCVIGLPLTRASTRSSAGGGVQPASGRKGHRCAGRSESEDGGGSGVFSRSSMHAAENLVGVMWAKAMSCGVGITASQALQGCGEFGKDGRPVLMRHLELERERGQKTNPLLVPVHHLLNRRLETRLFASSVTTTAPALSSIEIRRKALAWIRICMTSNSRSTESGGSPYRSCISPWSRARSPTWVQEESRL